MSITNLRKVGGSVMLTVPPSLLTLLHLQSGSTVDIVVEKGRLVIEPIKKPKYQLAELLAQCNPKAKRSKEDDEWINAPRIGREII
ncbi:MAG: AbrB/MazE/SpoVT family DNA-binding domain-containing protein [Burkholderiaceae bacterium]|jgi:antitoxin ChpS|nr:AbrB/MazE/SpoVT family DNA-binding domain-containing protein [Burkholderiaceae bacterium]